MGYLGMNKRLYIERVLGRALPMPKNTQASAFAPSNIALCKYWGKRDDVLNLPVTDSVSISLTGLGTSTTFIVTDKASDEIFLNDKRIDNQHPLAKRAIDFVDLFRKKNAWHFDLYTQSDLPVAAGLATSASGFAALTKVLNDCLDLQASTKQLTQIARCGSGSAARSFANGFVHWYAGKRTDGMDCYAESIDCHWRDLCLGLLVEETKQKPISSTTAMQNTVATSPYYKLWPAQVTQTLSVLLTAIQQQDFMSLGKAAEANALAMHSTMLTAEPPIMYWQPQSITNMQKVWACREQGLPIYFTEDAGPNIKLLFLKKQEAEVKLNWPTCQVIQPFCEVRDT